MLLICAASFNMILSRKKGLKFVEGDVVADVVDVEVLIEAEVEVGPISLMTSVTADTCSAPPTDEIDIVRLLLLFQTLPTGVVEIDEFEL